VNYDNSLLVTITVTCYSWVTSSGDHLFTCGTIFWPPHQPHLGVLCAWSNTHTMAVLHHGLYNFTVFFFLFVTLEVMVFLAFCVLRNLECVKLEVR